MEPITSIASLKRALETPGAVMIMDESTRLASSLQRSPDLMETVSQPRKIAAVRNRDVVVVRADGMPVYLPFPKRDNFITYGDNSYTILVKRGQGENQQVDRATFRIVDPSRPYEPSRLPINHPPLDPGIVAMEQEQSISQKKDQEARIEAASEKIKALSRLPRPEPDPQYSVYREACVAIIHQIKADYDKRKHYLSNSDIAREMVLSPIYMEADFTEMVQGDEFVFDQTKLSAEIRLMEAQAIREVSGMPRGYWRQVREIGDGGVTLDKSVKIAFASLGNGDACRVVFDGQITDDIVKEKMLDRDVHAFKHDVAFELARARLSHFNFAVGDKFSNIRIGDTKFSSATIHSISYDEERSSNIIELHMKKRGAAKTWVIKLIPESLASRIPLPDQPKSPATISQPAPTSSTPRSTGP